MAKHLTRLLAVLSLMPACRVEAVDVQEGVDHYPSGNARVTIEWFAPAVRGKFPAIFLLHGSGGLDPGTAQVFRAIGRGYTERGYVVFIPHLFEKTNHAVGQTFQPKELQSFMDAVEDAIKFAVASGIVDEDRLGMIGYSMGAHFAFSRGARDPRIKAIVSCSGSLPIGSRSKFPPVLILQGSADRGNPLANVKKFQEVLKEKGTPYANHIYKGMGHNFDVERWEDAAGRAGAFFDKHLRRPEPARPRKSQRGRARKDTDRVTIPRKEDGGVGLDRGGAPRKDEGAGNSEPSAVPRKDGEPDPSREPRADPFGVIFPKMGPANLSSTLSRRFPTGSVRAG